MDSIKLGEANSVNERTIRKEIGKEKKIEKKVCIWVQICVLVRSAGFGMTLSK